MTAIASLDREPSLSFSLQRVLFLFVWLTFFTNALVFKEPAPCDLLMMAFVIILPLFGLVRFTPVHILFFIGWMIVIATGLIVAGTHEFYFLSVRHMLITAYLAMFAVVLAGFINKDPKQHLEIILNGYMCGAIIAAVAGIVGYFDLIPGAQELFTKWSRVRGTFKDPNVFGPYLVPAFLFCIHNLLNNKHTNKLISLLLMGLFLFGILMCFSRGAWLVCAVASFLYLGFFFFTAKTNRQRQRTMLFSVFGLVGLLVLLGLALQSEKIKALWSERVSISQNYDIGDQGRFSGHRKAVNVILENPIGIGALYFGYYYHHELPHNLYLSMYLSTGWIGGTVFLILIISTLILGATVMFKRSSYQHYHAIMYSTYVGLVIESYIIDSDHWRLLYILMGIIWGTYAASRHKDVARA